MTDKDAMAHEPPPKARIDWTFNVGNMLTGAGMVVAILAGFYGFGIKIGTFELRLTSVETVISTIAPLVERSIRSEEKIRTLEDQNRTLTARIERAESRKE